MRNSKNLPDELPTPHRNFCRVACLCYRFDASFAVSRLLPLTQTPDLSSCLTQCGVCSWTRPDLRNKRVPSKHIYMDTCLYIMCVSVLCRERTTMFLDTKANARTQTHWAIPDRLVNALCNTSIENYQVLFSVDFCRSVKMQLRRPPLPPPEPVNQQKVYYCRPWPCVAALVWMKPCISKGLQSVISVFSTHSAKLATDFHSPRVNRELQSVSILIFYAGYYADDLATAVGL